MQMEYRYLLHLLRAYLHRDIPEACADVDWQKLTQLAGIHHVSGILGTMVKQYPICPDDRIKTALWKRCLGTVQVFTQRMMLADNLVSALEEAGIDHILMKGYELRNLYPDPDLRSFNDIDIVIRPEDRRRCDELMLSRGFLRHTDWEPVFSYVLKDELYEIHTDIMEIDVAEVGSQQAYFRQMWDHAHPVREHSYRFTPEFHFLYLLTHIAKHVHGSGAGVRMYLDIAAFIRHYKDSADWVWISEQLEVLQLKRFADVVFAATEHWFGVRCPVARGEVREDVLDEFLVFTMEAGTFGHYQRDAALVNLKNTDAGRNGFRVRQILKTAFPSAKTIESRYTYLQDRPWLLPAAWVHRLVKNRDRLEQQTQELHQVFRADAEQVRSLQKLMRSIGL